MRPRSWASVSDVRSAALPVVTTALTLVFTALLTFFDASPIRLPFATWLSTISDTAVQASPAPRIAHPTGLLSGPIARATAPALRLRQRTADVVVSPSARKCKRDYFVLVESAGSVEHSLAP
jgi:hypothetical protein